MKFKYIIILYLLFIFALHTDSQVTQSWIQTYNAQEGSWGKVTGIVADHSGSVYVCGFSIISNLNNDYDYITIKYNAQGIQQWIATYNGTANDWDEARAITIDEASNVYVTGFTVGVNTLEDYTTIKYDSNGVQKWVAKYEKPQSHDRASTIAIDSNSNVFVTGYSSDLYNRAKYCTIKYNSEGIQQWVNEYSSALNEWDEPHSIAADNEGNVIVTGQTREGSPPRDNYCTIKYNTYGVLQWIKKYNGTANETDIANSLTLDLKGNVYVTGKSEITNLNFDYATIKYDALGNQKWLATYDDPQHSNDEGISLIVDSDGSVYVTGQSETTATADYLTVKYDSNGVQKWSSRYNGPENYIDCPAGIKLDRYHNVYITGKSTGINYDYATLKYDSSGAQQWVMRFNSASNLADYGTSIVVDNQGNVIVTGWSSSNTYTNNFVTIKYSQPIGVKSISTEVPSYFILYQNYPNPFNPVTNIEFSIPKSSYVQLKIFDDLGREVVTLVNQNLKTGTYKVNWIASQYPSGIYFYKMQASDYLETKKMVLIK